MLDIDGLKYQQLATGGLPSIPAWYIIRSPSGRLYVGRAQNLRKRIGGHRSGTHNGFLKNSISRHGWDAHELAWIPAPDVDSLDDGEMWLIARLKTNRNRHGGQHMNLNDGGGTMRGYKHTQEAKAKLSAALKGRRFSEDTKRKMSESNKGKVFSQEHRENLSAALKGKPGYKPSEETKAKLSAALKGRKQTDDAKEKIRAARLEYWRRNKGRKTSEETKEKLSAAMLNYWRRNKGRKTSEETKEKLRTARLNYWRRKRNMEWKQVLIDFPG